MVIGLPLAERSNPEAQTSRPVTFEWALSLAMQSYPVNLNVQFCPIRNSTRGDSRDKIVKHALEHKARYLWFVDDDTAMPAFAARKLIHDLENSRDDVMVAGGIYCAKQFPCEPLVFRENGMGAFWKWKKNQVFEVEGIGTGCMMIKTELFKKLPEPWFVDGDESPLHEAQVVRKMWTDDLYFCAKVRKAGYRILADGAVICIHWDAETGIPYMLPDDSYPMRASD